MSTTTTTKPAMAGLPKGSMLPFASFRYIYPPRPELALPSTELSKYDDGKWIGQPKLNGDCTLVFTDGIEVVLRDRHAKPMGKAAKLVVDDVRSLHRASGVAKGKWIGLVCEFMAKGKKSSKGVNFNGQLVVFDAIVWDGMQLTGSTFAQRVALLDEAYGTEPGAETFLLATPVPGVHRVRTYQGGFGPLWADVSKVDMVEGLVLKMRDGVLEHGASERNTTGSQVKFRVPHKNYLF